MNHRKYRNLLLAATVLAGGMAATAGAHDADEEQVLDLLDLGRHSDFVFKGTVASVAFRDSEPIPELDASGAPVLDSTGQPVLQDGSTLAHTFVTYTIDQIYKGQAAGTEVTLRFLGGVQEDPVLVPDPTGTLILSEEVFVAGDSPLFDVGDRDILFVERNTDKPCPLADCGGGRFRLIEHDPASPGVRQVYNDLGEQILRVLDGGSGGPEVVAQARVGSEDDLPDVNTNTLGGTVLEVIEVKPDVVADSSGDGPADPPVTPGAQFIEAQFDDYLVALIEPAAPGAPPVVSADIAAAFFAKQAPEAAAPRIPREKVPKPERPWIDELPRAERKTILKGEREERKALKRSDGDPTLPEVSR